MLGLDPFLSATLFYDNLLYLSVLHADDVHTSLQLLDASTVGVKDLLRAIHLHREGVNAGVASNLHGI